MATTLPATSPQKTGRRGCMTVVARLERQVTAALRRAGYSGNHTTLVVAVSGGSDSLALLYCLHHLRERHRLRLQVAHLNHDFRGAEADADAQFVADLARELGLPVTVEKRDPQEYQQQRHISSFEQAARELRYTFLAAVAEEMGAAAVALGHTADDLAETVLLHILRGAGLHGLRGMSELSPWPWPGEGRSLSLFRPLLEATKADTLAYCRELGREYREDTGNYLGRFTRNRVRHDLLPLLASEYNPKVREALVRLARTAALELDYLEGEASRAWPQVATVEAEAVTFDRASLATLDPALQRLLLRRGYAALVGDTRRLREVHLDSMSELVSAPSGRAVALPFGLRLYSVYHRLVLCRDECLPCPFPPLEGEHPVTLPTLEGQVTVTEVAGWRVTAQSVPPPETLSPNEPLTARFDPSSLRDGVYIRIRRPGDRFHPLGMARDKKLQGFFTEARVPRAWRDRVPLLVAGPRIAWVVGYRIAHWARVAAGESGSTSAVQVTFEVGKS